MQFMDLIHLCKLQFDYDSYVYQHEYHREIRVHQQ